MTPIVLGVALLLAGLLLGQAVVPGAVVERRRGWTFSGAVAFAVLAVGLAIPTPLALFTWPLSALAAVAAVVLFRRARRPG